MDIYNKEKTEILETVDLTKGYLVDDTIIVDVEEVLEQKEIYHYETIKEYPNGGKDVKKVIDKPAIKGIKAHKESRKIKIYLPFTEEELLIKKEKEYTNYIEQLIREKYSLSDELGLLRQRETKPNEFLEYYNFVEQCKSTAKIKFNK